MKTLAVDDDRIVLKLLKGILDRAGFGAVDTCESAEAALDVIASASTPFSCFVLDIQMSGIDGIELCRRIRQLPEYRTTPILMLTALSERSYVERAFQAGATDYLTKPLDPTEIVVRVGIAEQLIKGRKALAKSEGVIGSLIEVLDRTTQHDVEAAVDLGKLHRLLGYPAFENVLYQSTRHELFGATVFAAKVRDVQQLHRAMPPLEFKNYLRTAAGALIDRLESHDVWLTYRGDGEFVGLVPRKGQLALKFLGQRLTFTVEDSEGQHKSSIPETGTLILGAAPPIRIPTRGEASKAIWTAIERARANAAPKVQREPKRAKSRDFPGGLTPLWQEDEDGKAELRAEFAALLSEQLNAERTDRRRGPLGTKRNVALFSSRRAVLNGHTRAFAVRREFSSQPRLMS